MNSLKGTACSPVLQAPTGGPLQQLGAAPPQTTKSVDSIEIITSANKRQNVSQEDIESQHESPPDLAPTYRAISTTRSAILLGAIIAGNCLCSGFIALCLWGFSTINHLSPWQKRAFNALSLLLSGVLGFGIGFLLDRIGLLARGTLLQSKAHSVKEVRILYHSC